MEKYTELKYYFFLIRLMDSKPIFLKHQAFPYDAIVCQNKAQELKISVKFKYSYTTIFLAVI